MLSYWIFNSLLLVGDVFEDFFGPPVVGGNQNHKGGLTASRVRKLFPETWLWVFFLRYGYVHTSFMHAPSLFPVV